MVSGEAKTLLLEGEEEDFGSFDRLELKLSSKNLNNDSLSPNFSLQNNGRQGTINPPSQKLYSSQKKYLTLLYCLGSFFLLAGLLNVAFILVPKWWWSISNSSNIDSYEVLPPVLVTYRPAAAKIDPTCSSHVCEKAAIDMQAWMNLSVDPCDNFYEYACGGWIKRNPIPSGESSWDVMTKLSSENRNIIRKELDRKGRKMGTKIGAEDKAKIFYASCLHAKEDERKRTVHVQSVPAWQTCFDETEQFFELALGAIFVRQSFHLKRKQKAGIMVQDIRQALLEILEDLDWMDDATKRMSALKVATISDQLGYQDIILSPADLDFEYRDVEMDEWDYKGNSERLFARTLLKTLDNGPGSLWKVTPETVNAFYSTVNNEIVIPAGILQRPFYHPGLPDSINLGGVGVVIGHELLHSFDDGYDAGDSNSPNRTFSGWWTNQTVDGFTEKAKCLVRQYSSMDVNGQNLNGRQTLDENVADQGGLRSAFRAFRSRGFKNEMKLKGMTEFSSDQMFFISYAQTWCSASTRASLISEINDSLHAPDSARVSGSLRNLEEFSEAFQCRLNSNMNPTTKCIVW